MRIAIVGTGISGMLSAYLLSDEHDVTLFEAASYIGGHTNTVRVPHEGREYAVDTGFIVYNDTTYPRFCELMDWLGVESKPTEMSFSVRCESTGLEYNGTSLNTLFAQRRNLLRPSFYGMIRDIVRFYSRSREALESGVADITLGDFLARFDYGGLFVDKHIIPMAAAIWSARPDVIQAMPLEFFLRFFANHGFLDVANRPQWRVILGGSSSYIGPLTAPFRDGIRTSSPVESIRRFEDRVEIRSRGETESFDAVVLSTHSDQALRLLDDPSDSEREILSAIEYQENDVVLHTDDSILPRRKLARASWNYHVLPEPPERAVVTYLMNTLQGIDAPLNFCITLNRREAIQPEKILREFTYHHPIFTPRAVAAQERHDEINGRRRTYYCGAYWGYGFHEDGVRSAIRVAASFGRSFQPCTAASTRVASATGASHP